MRRWQVGDRVVWPHREGMGRNAHTVRSVGTVIALDLPGLLPGVKVEFDGFANGVKTCYATYGELEAAPDHQGQTETEEQP